VSEWLHEGCLWVGGAAAWAGQRVHYGGLCLAKIESFIRRERKKVEEALSNARGCSNMNATRKIMDLINIINLLDVESAVEYIDSK